MISMLNQQDLFQTLAPQILQEKAQKPIKLCKYSHLQCKNIGNLNIFRKKMQTVFLKLCQSNFINRHFKYHQTLRKIMLKRLHNHSIFKETARLTLIELFTAKKNVLFEARFTSILQKNLPQCVPFAVSLRCFSTIMNYKGFQQYDSAAVVQRLKLLYKSYSMSEGSQEEFESQIGEVDQKIKLNHKLNTEKILRIIRKYIKECYKQQYNIEQRMLFYTIQEEIQRQYLKIFLERHRETRIRKYIREQQDYFQQADILFRLKDYSQCEKMIQKRLGILLRGIPNKRLLSDYYMLHYKCLLWSERRISMAIGSQQQFLLLQAIKYNPQNKKAYGQLAQYYLYVHLDILFDLIQRYKLATGDENYFLTLQARLDLHSLITARQGFKKLQKINQLLKNLTSPSQFFRYYIMMIRIDLYFGWVGRQIPFSVEISPANQQQYYVRHFLGNLYYQKKQYKAALYHYQIDQMIASQDIKQYYNIKFALCYIGLQDYQTAEIHLNKLKVDRPNNYLFPFAQACERMEKIDLLDKIVELIQQQQRQKGLVSQLQFQKYYYLLKYYGQMRPRKIGHKDITQNQLYFLLCKNVENRFLQHLHLPFIYTFFIHIYFLLDYSYEHNLLAKGKVLKLLLNQGLVIIGLYNQEWSSKLKQSVRNREILPVRLIDHR